MPGYKLHISFSQLLLKVEGLEGSGDNIEDSLDHPDSIIYSIDSTKIDNKDTINWKKLYYTISIELLLAQILVVSRIDINIHGRSNTVTMVTSNQSKKINIFLYRI